MNQLSHSRHPWSGDGSVSRAAGPEPFLSGRALGRWKSPVDRTLHARDPGLATGHVPERACLRGARRSTGAARAGVLRTAHGEVRTPVFMPVGTKGDRQVAAPGRGARRSAPRSCSATRTTCTSGPGDELIRELGGLHSLHGLGRADPDRLRRVPGLLAARHDRARRRRRRHVPERLRRHRGAVHARARGPHPGRTSAATSRCASTRCRRPTSRAASWQRRCAGRRCGPSASATRRAPTASCASGSPRAGSIRELRRRSTEEIAALGFDGNAIGGLAIGEDRDAMFEVDGLVDRAAAAPTGRATSWASATPRASSR